MLDTLLPFRCVQIGINLRSDWQYLHLFLIMLGIYIQQQFSIYLDDNSTSKNIYLNHKYVQIEEDIWSLGHKVSLAIGCIPHSLEAGAEHLLFLCKMEMGIYGLPLPPPCTYPDQSSNRGRREDKRSLEKATL